MKEMQYIAIEQLHPQREMQNGTSPMLQLKWVEEMEDEE